MDQNNHSGASEFSSTDPTFIDIKQFELILGKMQEGDVEDYEFWEELWRVPRLSPAELKFLRKEFVHDFEKIETGQFQLPIYADDLVSSGSNPSNLQRNATDVGKKRKGMSWSEEEKALFAEGLEKYGKGHWKDISKHFVTSRTPTQVASHAQKFFLAEKKKRKTLGISDLPHRHQESSPASHFPISSTFRIPPQQQGFEAKYLAPDYRIGNQFYREQNLPNFISLPPCQFDLQALLPSQFNQRVPHGARALVSDPSYRLQHQSHQTGCMNQRQHLMHSGNSTQRQFHQQTHAEPLLRAQQTLDELQSRTSFVNLQIVDPWSITSSNAAPRYGSNSYPSPTAQQPNSRMDQNHKNTCKP